VKTRRASDHSKDCMAVSPGGYSASNFTGSALCRRNQCRGPDRGLVRDVLLPWVLEDPWLSGGPVVPVTLLPCGGVDSHLYTTGITLGW